MQLYPAVDIKDGKCVRLSQGRFDDVKVYADSPASVAAHWEGLGATFLHIVDLDGAVKGSSVNRQAIKSIGEHIDIPFEVGGGVRTLEDIEELLKLGAKRVIIGTKAVEDPDFVADAVKRFGSDAVVLGLDARDGKVAVKGWLEDSVRTSEEFCLEMKKAGFDTTVADINEKSLAVAEKNGLKTKLLEPGEPLGENLADTVMMIEVLEHVPNPVDFLKSAIGAAKKRVVFSLPCTDDFNTLFECGLTYAHIAVSDHLWHFSYDEMKQMLDSLGVEYRLTMGDYLFPGAGIKLLRGCFKGPLGLLILPFRVLNKLGLIPKRYPSRFYGIIEKR